MDGLRSDALLYAGRNRLPGFERLLAGASTLNARTDPNLTITLPNHMGMVTGRASGGPGGHAWRTNSLDDAPRIVHVEAGRYVPSMFDVAHDHGLRTVLCATKEKFLVLDESWGPDHGAADATGADDGPDKIDTYTFVTHAKDQEEMDIMERELDVAGRATDALLAALAPTAPDADAPRTLAMLHYRFLDTIGHDTGWNLTPGSPYMNAVSGVDRELQRLFAAIDTAEHLRRTAVILTSDHGGGAPYLNHGQSRFWVNYVIPLLVWTEDGGQRDLYQLNTDRRADPGLDNPPFDTPGLPPIRNADAANIALRLLGLPALTAGAPPTLRVRPRATAG